MSSCCGITLHSAIKKAGAVLNAEQFRNQAGLAKLAAKWSAARLVEIWNRLPGAEQVKKFKDRNVAVERIWTAIQSLSVPEASKLVAPEPATEALQTPDVAPKGKASGKKTTSAQKTLKAATKARIPTKEQDRNGQEDGPDGYLHQGGGRRTLLHYRRLRPHRIP